MAHSRRLIPRRPLLAAAALLYVTAAAPGAAPAFRDTSTPDGWSVRKGKAAEAAYLATSDKRPLEIATDAPVPTPAEITVRFQAPVGARVAVQAIDPAATNVAALECSVLLRAANQAAVVARAAGQPMEADTISMRTWTGRDKASGMVTYAWRYPQVRNLWDERDRAEIGAAYQALVPLAEKVFTLRFVLTAAGREVWLDDRLVAEQRLPAPPAVRVALQVGPDARVLSADFATPADAGESFVPLRLAHYSHARTRPADAADGALERVTPASESAVPLFAPATNGAADIDVGDSLYRYRLTHGTGPDASYVNAQRTWPGAFTVDPAELRFRVPYRDYQNAWLLAWVDDDSNAVPRAVFRFYREGAGYAAATAFEISDAAIEAGLVTPLKQRAPNGTSLYLVRVPVDTDALYGFRDMANQFMEFELTKPLALTRSYPDPIYYGWHPAGPPSSIHVAAITLEAAPFSYEVQPGRVGFVFEKPEQAAYVIALTNTSSRRLRVKFSTRLSDYDGQQSGFAGGETVVLPRGQASLKYEGTPARNGWHQMTVSVEANGVTRSNTLSLVVLPPNDRTYGYAANETRFGLWTLWGHYLPLKAGAYEQNERYLELFRRLGLRRIGAHGSCLRLDAVKRHDFLPKSAHTIVAVFHRLNENDPAAMAAMVSNELAQVADVASAFPQTSYFYGGEWHLSREIQYAPWPRYTGDGDRDLTPDERQRVVRQTKIFTAIGQAMRAKCPDTKLYLQWGAPQGTIAFMKNGFPKELVDGFGMDAPMFELLPELSNVPGSINGLWWLREEARQLGWPRLPIGWCEGPFFPTLDGSLTERQQADHQIRYWLLGLAFGIEDFEAGVVDFDGGNYYGAEHYGAGVFNRLPLENPKPAAAAIATATRMLCGADVVGPVDTGSPTTCCMAFRRAKTGAMVYALWRVTGTSEVALRSAAKQAVVTDAMGNSRTVDARDGAISLALSPEPVWVEGVSDISGFALGAPRYDTAPAPVTRPLPAFTAANWTYDGSADAAYASNHFAVRRITDPQLTAEFGRGETGHADAVAITLPVQPGDRPLANRYGALVPRAPIPLAGAPAALGVWIRGNSSWGRVVYQLRDAKGETWTANGTKDDWNCDDPHGWSYVSFEGWRYVRFPLPSNQPYDAFRSADSVWWGSHGGDGIVDLPLQLVRVFVEARNEAPVLGVMRPAAERSYLLSGLAAEYDGPQDAEPAALARFAARMPTPAWAGPSVNPIARLLAEGAGEPTEIREFTEPLQWTDGRQMVLHFAQTPGVTYNLYLARYADGRGGELLKAGVTDGQTITGLRPGVEMFFFLTSVGADKRESKPSKPLRLVTVDKFAEK